MADHVIFGIVVLDGSIVAELDILGLGQLRAQIFRLDRGLLMAGADLSQVLLDPGRIGNVGNACLKKAKF